MMEMGRLEIFCFECGLEITDDQEYYIWKFKVDGFGDQEVGH